MNVVTDAAEMAGMNRQSEDEAEVRRLLGGLSLGEIPIAGSKRRSIAISLQGKTYRIGRIPANKAFVIIRDNLRLLYVAPDYGNYRYAARKVFGKCSGKFDIDHALGRKLTQRHGYWYTLVTRLDPRINRSHGRYERPPTVSEYRINLEKFCYTDERILRKMLGLSNATVPESERTTGDEVVKSHVRALSRSDALKARMALGMSDPCTQLGDLHPIDL